MSKYKLNFKLKQHTPIIHFQHDQSGATLRASELKPKLDKFLIKKLRLTKIITIDSKEKEVPKSEYKHWFINEGKEHLALNYKVKIIDNDKRPLKGQVVILPPTQEQWVLSKGISLEIKTFYTDLIKEIKRHIDLFFCLNNFGKRQNKGFGCFYPEYLSVDKFVNKLKEDRGNLYKYNILLKDNLQTSTYFYDMVISKKWGELKSGLNIFWTHSPIYKKSKVFEYLEDNSLRWDKRWIKRQLKNFINKGSLSEDLLQRKYDPIDLNNVNSWEDTNGEEYRFGRAMLGLAEHYEFQTTDRDIKYKVIISNDNIERFKSPVTFKVFNQSIYAIVEDVPENMFGASFDFKVQKKKKIDSEWKDVGRIINITEDLKTPFDKEFDINDFLDNHFPSVGFKKI